MSILIVSDRKINKKSTDFLVNSFVRKFGAKVIYTKSNEEDITIVDRIFHKINIEFDKSSINKRLLLEVSKASYKIILILKGNRIYPWVLKKIKSKNPNTKILSWSGDNMTKWHNKSLFYHFGINYYDIALSVNIPDYKNMEKFCKIPVYYFNKRADDLMHIPMNKDRKTFMYDVIFIGSYDKERIDTLKFLAKNGIKIEVFGAMWDKCKSVDIHKNIKINFKELIGKDYVEAISYSKITIGFLRKFNCDTQTSRTFEIPACGGFMLMERTAEHLKLFKEGIEAEFFESNLELLNKINYYLKMSAKREEIVKKGRIRIEKGGYFFINLVDEIMEKVIYEDT